MFFLHLINNFMKIMQKKVNNNKQFNKGGKILMKSCRIKFKTIIPTVFNHFTVHLLLANHYIV